MSDEDFLTPRERAALERNPEARLVSQPPTDEEITTNQAVGVGGALALLIVILMFIGPIFSVFVTVIGHQDMLALNPELSGAEEWQTILTIDWVTVIIAIALSVFAGYLLLKRHVPSTKWFVIALIWLSSVGVSILGLIFANQLFPGILTASDAGATLGRPIVFSVIWTSYLLLSKRVRRTYSR